MPPHFLKTLCHPFFMPLPPIFSNFNATPCECIDKFQSCALHQDLVDTYENWLRKLFKMHNIQNSEGNSVIQTSQFSVGAELISGLLGYPVFSLPCCTVTVCQWFQFPGTCRTETTIFGQIFRFRILRPTQPQSKDKAEISNVSKNQKVATKVCYLGILHSPSCSSEEFAL